jgi:xanthine dehydrogenase accessory factor
MTPLIKLLKQAELLQADRVPFVLATVVRAERPTSAKPGDRALVMGDGTVDGFIGGSCAVSTVRDQALRLLDTGESTLLRITPYPTEDNAEGILCVHNHCLSGGTVEIFLEAVIPPAMIHVFGHGPVAKALLTVGTAIGYHVVTTTDPAMPISLDTTAVIVASHGLDEEKALTLAIQEGVPYIGLVASPTRGAAVLAGMDGGDRVHCPAGLDIGARNANEIAVAVFAQILAERYREIAEAER